VENFSVWWGGLTSLNQWFFIAAGFFTVFFLWQLVMAILGVGGGDTDLDSHVDPAWEHHGGDDASQTVMAFKLLSVRSILAFFTLFTWAGSLYLSHHVSVTRSLVYAILWGAAAMVIVSLLFHMLCKLTSTGAAKIGASVGVIGAVYLDIPAGVAGEVRVLCGDTMTHFKARLTGKDGLKAGAQVRVTKVLDSNTVEVEAISASV